MLARRTLVLVALSLPALLLAQNDANPEVKTFSVIGKVKHPGSYGLRDGTRVMDAISMAGGFADFFNRKKIAVIRNGERHTFNYTDFIRRRDIEQNILLENGDVIEVP
jgi:polysaccharide export outer membrane protein